MPGPSACWLGSVESVKPLAIGIESCALLTSSLPLVRHDFGCVASPAQTKVGQKRNEGAPQGDREESKPLE